MSLTLLELFTKSLAALVKLFFTWDQSVNTDLHVGGNVNLKDEAIGIREDVFLEWSS